MVTGNKACVSNIADSNVLQYLLLVLHMLQSCKELLIMVVYYIYTCKALLIMASILIMAVHWSCIGQACISIHIQYVELWYYIIIHVHNALVSYFMSFSRAFGSRDTPSTHLQHSDSQGEYPER